jgi:RNA polymerase sigma-70 factor (ECF subfamily)
MTYDRTRSDALPAALRCRLIRLAYRYLGSVADAEDIVQDAFLRLVKADDVREPEAWLARVVTNAALDRLRAIRASRETYVGPWLPEPLIEADESPSDRELDISFAVMRTLEALSPLERAAFFLHDLFGMDFQQVADTLERTPAAVRKLASRARQAVSSGQKRFPASPSDVERLLSAIGTTVVSEDVEGLALLLSADVELVTDGGGKAVASLNVLYGRDAVCRFLAGIARKQAGANFRLAATRVNGSAGVLIEGEFGLDSVLTLDIDREGCIAAIYIVRNPEKLRHIVERRDTASRPANPDPGGDGY